MRPAILALLLCTSPAAFGQWAQPAPVNPSQPGIPPRAFNLPPSGRGFNQPPTVFPFNGTIPRPAIVLPPTHLDLKQQAKIDPQIIVRPPQSSIGYQAPGTLIAQNLYPGLQFLPIGETKGKLEPIPTTWPNFKMEQIPIDVSKVQITYIGNRETTDQKKKK